MKSSDGSAACIAFLRNWKNRTTNRRLTFLDRPIFDTEDEEDREECRAEGKASQGMKDESRDQEEVGNDGSASTHDDDGFGFWN
jgi:hypothetical protein